MTSEKKRFLITGAGPVGLATALLLQKAGFEATIYEKRPDPRTFSEKGRSINLALSDRGFRTLGLVNLAEKIKNEAAIPMKGRMVHTSGELSFQPYSLDGKAIYSVSRRILNLLLLEEATQNHITTHFDFRCSGYDQRGDRISFEKHGKPFLFNNPGMILGCDGAFSALRKSLHTQPGFQHTDTTYEYAYKELTIPSGLEGTWKMEPEALHIWPQKSFMLIALPNTDGSFTCTLFLQQKGPVSFEQITLDGTCIPFFEKHFPDLFSLIPDLEEEFDSNPISTLFMESCQPWNIAEKLLLLGDAAHAIVPFYGQGLNCGLEDARLFYEFILENSLTGHSISQFQSTRKPDTDAIAELALQNFIEMRDSVQDEAYLQKRALEGKLKKLFPDVWYTQYELVTFSHTPYSKALETGQHNQKKLHQILSNELLADHLLQDTLSAQDMQLLLQIISQI